MPKRLKRVQSALWEKASAFHWGMTIMACLGASLSLPLGLFGVRGREADFSTPPRTVRLSAAPVEMTVVGEFGIEMSDCGPRRFPYLGSGAGNQRGLAVALSGSRVGLV